MYDMLTDLLDGTEDDGTSLEIGEGVASLVARFGPVVMRAARDAAGVFGALVAAGVKEIRGRGAVFEGTTRALAMYARMSWDFPARVPRCKYT